MLNHFRTLLLNIDSTGNPNDHLADGYYHLTAPNSNSQSNPPTTAVTGTGSNIPKPLIDTCALLFNSTLTQDQKINLLNHYIDMIYACNMEAYITQQDNRTTYTPNDFSSLTFNTDLYYAVNQILLGINSYDVSNFLTLLSESTDLQLENVLKTHFNPIYKLSALIILYVIKFNTIWQTLQ